MTQAQAWQIGIAIVGVTLATWLSATEAAIAAVSKFRAAKLLEDQKPGAVRISKIAENSTKYLNTVMFLRRVFEITSIVTVVIYLLGYEAVNWRRALLAIVVMLVVAFILWGVGPRTIGRQKAVSVLRFSGFLLAFLAKVFGPIAQLMIVIGNALTPGKGFMTGPFSSEAELRELVDVAEESSVIEEDERKMIHSVFELGDTLVKEIMVPRTDMLFINADQTLRQFMSLALRSGFSRVPVIGDGIDDVLGIAYLKDVSKRIYDYPAQEATQQIKDLMREAKFCPDSKPADDLLREMQKERNHIVIVVDEFGGTAGLVTIEDILEEIVGEITDEYDAEPMQIAEVAPGQYRVSARMPVDDMAEMFGLIADDEDVETVGGLMAKLLNRVPIPGAKAEWEGIEIIADRAVGRRNQIGTMLVRKIPEI